MKGVLFMRQTFKRGIVLLLTLFMALSVSSVAFAANDYTINSTTSTDNYYNLISKKDWNIAPGITESEIVLNNDSGSRRQVLFVMEADANNEYVKVINSYTGMVPEYGNYKTGVMSQQAAYAEANGYGNVVGAMNTCLSWYTNYPADRVGEPLGFIMLDAETLFDPANCGYAYGNVGFPSVLVINKDFDENGNPRPADIPKVEMPQIRSSADLDGWEEQVIPASSGYIVKDGVNTSKPDHTSSSAPRSVVGIKPDGTVVIMLNDGRQSPYSEGMTMYELAEVMLDLGCSYAVNCDGGGSSTYLSERPGEDLKVNNSPSDGAERPTTSGILFVTTAPADGAFARATIFTDGAYYTPGSTVKFDALGTDLVGTAAEIPDDVEWQLADPSMGTIENGVFVSNGTIGTVTAQMVYGGKVVGEHSIEIVVPTEFSFSQAIMTVPFDKEVTIGLTATINGGLNDVILKPEDVEFVTTNSALGTFNGFKFTSVSEDNVPADLTSTLTATLVHNRALVTTASLNLGRGSQVLFDFEDASDIDEWNIGDVNGNDRGFYQHLSLATALDGQVHNGNSSMRVEMNPIAANGISNGGYGQSDLYLDEGVVVENAKTIGFWAYIPDEYEHCWIRVLYWYDSNGDGTFDKKNTISVISQPEVYNSWDESGWKYFSVDVSKYAKVLIPGVDCKDKIAYNASKNDANNFRFIEFMFPHTNTNDLWKTYGTINGLQTVYVDNITADFSDAVDDREAPKFSNVELLETEKTTVLKKYETVTTKSNLVTVSASVTEDTAKTNATGLNVASAKAYVDGVNVPVTFANGKMSINDIALANGVHRVKFEICDNMGNKSVVIRLINVASPVAASTISVVPADPELDGLYGGSVYWMNLNANMIETIQSVETVIDLNYGNHFELDHMVLAEGFEAEYTIDEENNTATVVITRTGDNNDKGEAVLAALPIRVIYYDTDINIDEHDAKAYWDTYGFWPYDLKVDVDMGAITYVDGYESEVIGAFSNEEFSVDTELQTAFSDPAFKAERGIAHVHTPVAVDDLKATCTEEGYEGRTVCEVCDSVVEWGTTLAATGHEYGADGKCKHCEATTAYEGLVEIDGKWYYAIAGNFQSGWQMIGDEWHYFDETTKAAQVGELHYFEGVKYVFDETGKLTDGVWKVTEDGIRYYYGPSWYIKKWIDIDGSTYYFDADGYCAVGNNVIKNATNAPPVAYVFGDDGKLINTPDTTGIFNSKQGLYYLVDGNVQVNLGLIKIDVEGKDKYIYIRTAGQLAVGEYKVWLNHDIVPYASTQTFDENGYMVTGLPEPETFTGIRNENGTLYYYVDDIKQLNLGLIEIEVDGTKKYIYVRTAGQLAVGEYKVWLNHDIVPYASAQTFDENGYMVTGLPEPETFTGIRNENGTLYYYVDNVKQLNLGLIKIDVNGESKFIYVRTAGQLAVGEYTVWLDNGIVPYASAQKFDENGYMLNAPAGNDKVNGIVDENGTLYYYVDDVKQVNLGLIKIDVNGESKYIYVRTAGQLAVGEYTVWLDNGIVPYASTQIFDENGYMLNAPATLDGVVDENGTLYYYVDGVKQLNLGLIKINVGGESKYIYVRTAGQLAVGEYTVWLNNDIVPYASAQRFDANGYMIVE